MSKQFNQEVIVNVTLLKPTFKTFGNGKIGVVIRIDGESPEDKDILVNSRTVAVVIDSTKEFHERKLFPLSVHRISLNLETGKITFGEILTVAPETKRPTHCPSCGRPLNTFFRDGELWCVNSDCPGHSRACVRAIVKGRLNHGLEKHLDAFLDGYLCPEPMKITTLFDFQQAFLVANAFDKQLSLRKDQWIAAYGDMGPLYWRIEMAYQGALNRKQIPAQEFWDTCCFPFIPPVFESQLPVDFYRRTEEGLRQYLNPTELLLGGVGIRDWMANASMRSRNLIINNHDFIKLLYQVYSSFGTPEWI